MGWIGVDLDGTLAFYDEWESPEHIGDPIPAMHLRVMNWLADGIEVRIVTARASDPSRIQYVMEWLKLHGMEGISVTNQKDFGMIELWDDRAIRVIKNTGKIDNNYIPN